MLETSKYINIEKTKISAKYNCTITLNTNEMKEQDFFDTGDEIQIIPIFDIFIDEKEDFCQIILPYEKINIKKTENTENNNGIIKISYIPDDVIIEQSSVNKSLSLMYADRLMGGRISGIKNPESLFQILSSIFTDTDFIHIEVLVSHLFRDTKGELSRLTGEYDKIWGVNKIAINESWFSAMSYRDVEKGITKGLVSEKTAQFNTIEKVLSSKFDEL